MRNWINSAKDMDYWRALVNAAMNLRVPQAMELVLCSWIQIIPEFVVLNASDINVAVVAVIYTRYRMAVAYFYTSRGE